MAEITDLTKYRQKRFNDQFESAWRFLFHETYAVENGLQKIPAKHLAFVAQPDDLNSQVTYALINRTLNGPEVSEFEDLEMLDQLHIIDIHLFISDRFRFEIMRRLGWVVSYLGDSMTVVDLITDYRNLRDKDLENPPILSQTHPKYDEFISQIAREQGVFVRKLYPTAMNTFRETL